MTIFVERPYIAALKESFLSEYCSNCFKKANNQCSHCKIIVYCNDHCEQEDIRFHRYECQIYQKGHHFNETVILRMMMRVITRLEIDNGEPDVDLCLNVPNSIRRRTWFDLLGHREEIIYSKRHGSDWMMTKNQFDILLGDKFHNIDLLEIFGKILINRFRVGIHENVSDGRFAIGWAIYLTVSRFNHSCEPDLLQCSYDINMRLKLADVSRQIPDNEFDFNQLTVSYRHQNDFRITNPLSYVPTRKQRRNFVSYFFFNCHCSYCADDLRNRYGESSTNRRCEECGDFLVLQGDSSDSTCSILTCLGQRKCHRSNEIIDRIQISFIDSNESSIDILERKLDKLEKIFHPNSISLVQEREKIFFIYQKLLKDINLDEEQHRKYIERAIQLGEILIQSYDIHLKYSSIYPKVFLMDVARLCQKTGKQEKAKELLTKLYDLWISDYPNLNINLEIS